MRLAIFLVFVITVAWPGTVNAQEAAPPTLSDVQTLQNKLDQAKKKREQSLKLSQLQSELEQSARGLSGNLRSKPECAPSSDLSKTIATPNGIKFATTPLEIVLIRLSKPSKESLSGVTVSKRTISVIQPRF